jgi:hypothetical protein
MLLVDMLSSASLLKQYMYCDMTPESWNSSLLGNGLANTVPRKRTCETIVERCFPWELPGNCITRVPGELE